MTVTIKDVMPQENETMVEREVGNNIVNNGNMGIEMGNVPFNETTLASIILSHLPQAFVVVAFPPEEGPNQRAESVYAQAQLEVIVRRWARWRLLRGRNHRANCSPKGELRPKVGEGVCGDSLDPQGPPPPIRPAATP